MLIEHDYVRPIGEFISAGCAECNHGVERHRDWHQYEYGDNGWIKRRSLEEVLEDYVTPSSEDVAAWDLDMLVLESDSVVVVSLGILDR